METHSKHVIARITPSLDDKLENSRGSKSRSDAARDALEFSADTGVLSLPPEQLRSTTDIVRVALAATATFSAAAHPILAENYALNCEIHRDWLIAEVAEVDLTFVLNIARAIDANQAGVESAIIAVFDRFFSGNPGAEFYELARQDLIWLELQRNKAVGTPQREFVAYTTAGVDRANIRERWLWHRRLLSELALANIDYHSLFKWSESDHMFRLVDKPRLREAYEGGRLTLEVGDPIKPPPSRAPARGKRDPYAGKSIDGSDE